MESKHTHVLKLLTQSIELKKKKERAINSHVHTYT